MMRRNREHVKPGASYTPRLATQAHLTEKRKKKPQVDGTRTAPRRIDDNRHRPV
jgi:hypothetical protein